MYVADNKRYDKMIYRKCGNSGLKLPILSLGLWHNFGFETPLYKAKELLFTAFDHGITHFDLANNPILRKKLWRLHVFLKIWVFLFLFISLPTRC
jgi:hypothetical protein